jgi:hypothetical protein
MGVESGRFVHAATSSGRMPARISGGCAWWRCPVAGGHVESILYWFGIKPLRRWFWRRPADSKAGRERYSSPPTM